MKLSRLTLEIILKASHCSSKDETRAFLCGVMLHAHEDHLRIVATNGYILVVHKTYEKELCQALGDRKIILDIKYIKTHLKPLLKTSKGNAKKLEFNFELVEKGLLIEDTLFNLIEREYPRYESIMVREGMKKKEEQLHKISFNADLLKSLVKAMEDDNTRVNGITLVFKDNFSPICVINNDSTLVEAILMPLKVEHNL